MGSEEAPSHSPQVSPFIFQTNQNVSQAAALRAGSALWGEARHLGHNSCPPALWGLGGWGWGDRTSPGQTTRTQGSAESKVMG